MSLNDDDLLRYSRQIMLPEIDIDGQERLAAARVLILGLGGLGSPAALYLGGAGVGTLVLADGDQVEYSNLQRQIAHSEARIGQYKAASAAIAVGGLNQRTQIEVVNERLTGARLNELVGDCDLVLDATDNYQSRCEVNAACWSAGIPLVSGAAIRWEGQVTAFDPRNTESPCYQCLYPTGDDAELNCAENGVIAPLVGVIGAMQALEAIKLICDFPDTLVGHVLYFDGKRAEWRRFGLPRYPQCPTCAR